VKLVADPTSPVVPTHELDDPEPERVLACHGPRYMMFDLAPTCTVSTGGGERGQGGRRRRGFANDNARRVSRIDRASTVARRPCVVNLTKADAAADEGDTGGHAWGASTHASVTHRYAGPIAATRMSLLFGIPITQTSAAAETQMSRSASLRPQQSFFYARFRPCCKDCLKSQSETLGLHDGPGRPSPMGTNARLTRPGQRGVKRWSPQSTIPQKEGRLAGGHWGGGPSVRISFQDFRRKRAH